MRGRRAGKWVFVCGKLIHPPNVLPAASVKSGDAAAEGAEAAGAEGGGEAVADLSAAVVSRERDGGGDDQCGEDECVHGNEIPETGWMWGT